LQRGLQVNIELKGDRAAFYRVLQDGKTHQIALVLLNKGGTAQSFEVRQALESGRWVPAFGGAPIEAIPGGALHAVVAPHDVAVFVLDAPVSDATLKTLVDREMARARRHVAD
jgi:cyclomaltodextrin glucanotransferase